MNWLEDMPPQIAEPMTEQTGSSQMGNPMAEQMDSPQMVTIGSMWAHQAIAATPSSAYSLGKALNAASPADDVASYGEMVRQAALHVAELSQAASPDQHAATVAAAFLPDQLRYRPGQPAQSS